MEEDGQSKTCKWQPVSASTQVDAKPILKHAKPVRAKFSPRVYRHNNEHDSSVLSAFGNANSQLTNKNNSGAEKKCDESKPSENPGESAGMSVGNKSSLRVKGVSASICIDVEPFENLSSNRTPTRNTGAKCDPEISESKKRAIQFTNENGSEETKVIFVDNAWDINVTPKRSPGRPRGSTKKRRGKCFYSMTRIKKPRNVDPVERYTPEDFRPCDSPRKQAEPAGTSRDEKSQVVKSNAGGNSAASNASPSNDASNKLLDATPRCNICNKVFSNSNRLQTHMHWHVKNKVFKCKICKKTVKSFGHYMRHQQTHKADKTILKSQQSGIGINASNAKTSKAEGGKVHKCNICSRPYRQLVRLKLHLLSHEKNHATFMYRCKVCSKEFKNFGWLKHHALKSHDIEKVHKGEARIYHPKSRAQKEVNMLKMQTVSNKTSSPKPVDVSNDQVKNFKSEKDSANTCDICNKTFRLANTLIRHKELHIGKADITHGQKKCKSGVNQISDQVKEETEQSNADKLHKCNKCDRSFMSVHGLRRHLTWHRGQSEPSTQSRDNSKYSLRQQSSSSRSSCPSSKANDPLPNHEKSFQCLSCCESFPTESELKAHVDKLHLKEQETSTKTSPEKQEWIKYTKEDGKFIYRCGLCTNSDRPFAAVASVRKHVGMVHRDYTENLVEPAGIYEDVQSKPSVSKPSNPPSSSNDPSDTTESLNTEKTCTCNGRGKAFVYKNNKLTHLPSNCPVHDKESSEPVKKLKGSQILRCKHCDEEYDEFSREEFQKHELSHELEAKEPSGMTYACFECELEFTMVNDLMDHYEKEH